MAVAPLRLGRQQPIRASFRSAPAAPPTSSRASCSIRCRAQLGQPIVVENRVGAGGTLGTAAVAKAEPDGHTLLAHSNAHTISPAVYANLPYDPGRRLRRRSRRSALAERADHLAVEGFQDHPGAGRGRQGQARLVQLRLGRRRLRHPSERREAQAQRRASMRCTCRSAAAPRRSPR